MIDYSEDYLLGRKVRIFQPKDGYRASSDAVLLASAVTDVKRHDSFLDAGSGTGAVSLCLAARLCEHDIRLTGIEIQPDLVELSSLSARANGFGSMKFINTDFKNAPLPFCSFHHVISNPPYAEKDTPSPQKGKSTAHNFSSVPNLSEWIRLCIKMIRPQGYFYMINRASALDEILYQIHGKLGGIRVVPVCSQRGQDAKRIIVIARKDCKAPLRLCPPLIIHESDGTHTPEAEAILRGGKALFSLG